jgi:glycosyltransferase involved in cell wall biosynthesis
MSSSLPHISVCICTFRRPALLKALLDKLEFQQTEDEFTYSVVVSDNDAEESARLLVSELSATSKVEIVYCSEPRQNIALARNKALEHSRGEFIAFIDDDEFPEPDWLLRMLKTCRTYEAAGILGPVKPYFEELPPGWIRKGAFFERPEHKTGRLMHWEESRTGNLLFRRNILAGIDEPFKPEFGTGGEDKDFFMRMTQQGHVFRWCNEGVTYETVPPDRWKRRYLLKRAMLRGKNILKHPAGRIGLVARSMVAAPMYSLMLPFTLLIGQHIFMKVCIKLCDHTGRILALFGLNPVAER